MAELSAFLMTLCLFLSWRLYVANKKVYVFSKMLSAMVDGKVEIRRTDNGIELEIKANV